MAAFDLGFDEVLLPNADGRNQTALQIWKAKPQSEDSITTAESDRYITISTAAFTYKYDKFTGMFAKMTFEGKEVLDKPMNFNIWRAPTDNDRSIST